MGKISLFSEYGKGSTFSFTLQMAGYKPANSFCVNKPKINKKIEVVKMDKISKKSFTVLIAEDEPMNMLLIKTIMNNLFPNIKIIEAKNGIEALEKTKNNEIDLIFMDIQMPEIDGLDATKNIRKYQEFNKIPIVALTAGALKEEREKCISAGMDDFLTKPISIDKLNNVIEKYLFLK